MDYILEYFNKTVETFPNREAVDDGVNCYGWRELHLLTQHIASAVAEKSIAGRPIPVFMEKSADAVAAFLGIISAGCFYVYLNPDLPDERIRRMLQVLDSDTAIVDERLKKRLILAGFQGNLLGIEKAKAEPIHMAVLNERITGIQNKDYLYGIFTSGSTGTPKNVVVSHQAVLDFMEDFCQEFPVNHHDILGNQAPLDFDVSVKDIYLSVITGAKLVLVPRRMFTEPALLLDYLCEQRVTILIWAASALCIVSGMRGFEYKIPGLIRRVMFSGEVMPQKQLKIWRNALPKAEFINLYGPTEVTCNCTFYRVTGREPEHVPLPIGIPFAKRNVFLLNEYDMPVM
ncbi:MAG: AMP-binding protein, partial [[Clostridium] symbiosum]|nr:AMP-binding protein [[Clostridium] symbiosum]